MAGYGRFGQDHAGRIRGSAALCPPGTATVMRVAAARGGDVVSADGPCAETKEVLTGFYLLKAENLDHAVIADRFGDGAGATPSGMSAATVADSSRSDPAIR